MTASSKAVFLSYASEDAEAAARLCAALRAVGIEVWFDQSELRGGDAWDRQIRKQIHECALFVAVVSAHSNARSEGYFRREWRLAVERSHDMAEDAAFLLPVVIDNTPDATARVPDHFREVQWVRAPDGNAPPAFAERVLQLLSPAGQEPPIHPPAFSAARRAVGSKAQASNPRASWGIAMALVFIAAMLVTVGYVAIGRFVRPNRVTPAESAAPTAAAVSEKSIAVLPFVDMSEQHDQEYFSDGLSEELIDRLAHSPDLKVIGRTSSFAFKGKNEDMRTIAAKLGVANLLEGSVRKAGVELRITAQLVRASDGVHLWSQSFDRKLTDIFKLQEEISDTVAKALNVALGARASAGPRDTRNVEAYNLVLQGFYFFMRGNAGDDARAVATYQRALELDPRYPTAWAKLARVHAWQAFAGELSASEAESKGMEEVRRALEIDPKCAEAYYARGNIYRLVAGNWTAALADYKQAVMLDPDGEIGRSSKGNIVLHKLLITGNFSEYFDWARTSLARNPLDTQGLADLATAQQSAGLLDEAAATSRKLLELNPAYATAPALYAQTLLLMGRKSDALAAVQTESDPASKLMTLACVYWALDRRVESDAALHALEQGFARREAYMIAEVRAYRGENDVAFSWLERAFQETKGGLEPVKVDPFLRSLHGDKRFKMLLRKLNIPET
jgi:TolB-like protein/predicted TPR repeat methyltransferase